jgi:dATP pyrophosphohydrolase
LRDLEIDNDYEIFPEWRHRYLPGTTRNIEHVFVLELPTTVPVQLNPDEHSDYRWLKFDSAIALATSHTNRDAIQLVRDRAQGMVNG